MNNELLKKLSDERFELSTKIDKLEIFLNKKHDDISKYHNDLLHKQFSAMIDYHHILCKRIIDLLEVKI